MFRWAFRIVCAISLLLCAAAIVLWVRAATGDEFSGVFRDGRYTATSDAGLIRLVGPPPAAADPNRRREAEQLVASLDNDQLNWPGWYSDPIDTFDPRGISSVDPPVPDEGTPAETALKKYTFAELARPLLRAMENPAQATVAHVLLVQLSLGYR